MNTKQAWAQSNQWLLLNKTLTLFCTLSCCCHK